MGYSDAFTLAYSHIPLIIKKSKDNQFTLRHMRSNFFWERILLAGIQNMAKCPCPRCLVLKADLDQLGSVRNANKQMSGARSYLANRIINARNLVYNLGCKLSSVVVKRLLHSFSLVPTLVGHRGLSLLSLC
jgi:hypothetical protein